MGTTQQALNTWPPPSCSAACASRPSYAAGVCPQSSWTGQQMSRRRCRWVHTRGAHVVECEGASLGSSCHKHVLLVCVVVAAAPVILRGDGWTRLPFIPSASLFLLSPAGGLQKWMQPRGAHGRERAGSRELGSQEYGFRGTTHREQPLRPRRARRAAAATKLFGAVSVSRPIAGTLND